MATNYTTPSGAVVDAGGNLISPPPTSGASNDPFISEIQSKLLSSAGMVSSADSKIEAKIGEAIAGVKSASEASKGRIESQFGREIDATRTEGEQKITSFAEASRGFATNTAAVKKLQDYTEKSVRDLEMRREELILAGEAEAASQIAGLQLKALEFEQDAVQRAFNNILSIGNFGVAASAERRATRAQDFSERSTIANVALQYGLTVQPGDTIDSITARAMPVANEKQKLELEKMRTEIARTKADTQRTLAELGNSTRALTDAESATLARVYLSNPAALSGLIKNPSQLAQILDASAPIVMEQTKRQILLNASSNGDRQDDIDAINENPNLSPTQKAEALRYVAEAYGPEGAKSDDMVSIPGLTYSAADWYVKNLPSALEFLTGIKNRI